MKTTFARKSLLVSAIAGALLFAGSVSAQETADRSEMTTAANTESAQPMSDTWITTKVKADLLAESDVSGLDISVETANGTVSLSGDVDNQAQIDRATAIAREIEGVKSVDAKQLKVKRGM
jgi:hyperosmotically inducible protein